MKPFGLLQVGINAYEGSGKLNGCVNDVMAMSDTLTRLNGRMTGYRQLLDKKATLANMRLAMREMVRKHTEKPVWIFQYSGHGTLWRDKSGDDASGIDGALVPVDYKRKGVLLDDEIGWLTDQLPKDGKLILWLDSCYAGAAQRSWMPRMLACGLKQPVPRYLDLGVRGTANNTLKNYDPVKFLDINDERSVLIATSQPNVTSDDAWIEGKWRGAGTHALLLAWQSVGLQASYIAVQEVANYWLANRGHRQRIVLGGREENLKQPFLT